MTHSTPVRELAAALARLGLATASVPFDMCGTGSRENQLPMKLAFGASLLLQVMWSSGSKQLVFWKDLNASPLRAHWNSSEC